VRYAKTAEPIQMTFGIWTRVGQRSNNSGATWRIWLNRPLQRRCGLMSVYFDYLFSHIIYYPNVRMIDSGIATPEILTAHYSFQNLTRDHFTV